MKLFFIKIITLFLPAFSLIITINYFVDPANLYSNSKYEKRIAQYLCDNLNVTNLYNYDERIMGKAFIDCLNLEPDILILGSSRSMLLSTEMFISKNLKNNSVSGATIEDYLAIYNLYEKRNLKPKTIILGLDPWILNGNNNQGRWRSLANDYFNMLEKIGASKIYNTKSLNIDRWKIILHKYSEIVSIPYFQQSISTLKLNKDRSCYPTQIKVNDTFTKLSDGSISYDKKFREKTELEIENMAKNDINNKNIYSLNNFYHFSQKNQKILEAFIQYLKTKGINIVFYFPPYHPIVYEYFCNNDEFKIVLKAEDYFCDLAKKNKIKTIGSYNPDEFELLNSDFYDGMHCSEKSTNKIMQSLNNQIH